MVLSSKKVPVDYIDVAASEDAKAEMREKAGDPGALPPQFVHRQNGYLGVGVVHPVVLSWNRCSVCSVV